MQRIEESGIARAFPDTTFASFYCSSHVNGITCMLTINRKIGTLLPLENLQHLLTRSLFSLSLSWERVSLSRGSYFLDILKPQCGRKVQLTELGTRCDRKHCHSNLPNIIYGWTPVTSSSSSAPTPGLLTFRIGNTEPTIQLPSYNEVWESQPKPAQMWKHREFVITMREMALTVWRGKSFFAVGMTCS